jgi:hypothetical protein
MHMNSRLQWTCIVRTAKAALAKFVDDTQLAVFNPAELTEQQFAPQPRQR